MNSLKCVSLTFLLSASLIGGCRSPGGCPGGQCRSGSCSNGQCNITSAPQKSAYPGESIGNYSGYAEPAAPQPTYQGAGSGTR